MSQQIDQNRIRPSVNPEVNDGVRELRSFAGLGNYFPQGVTVVADAPTADLHASVEKPMAEPDNSAGIVSLAGCFPERGSIVGDTPATELPTAVEETVSRQQSVTGLVGLGSYIRPTVSGQ